MAFDKLFPEISQPQSTAPVPGAIGGQTSLADAWQGYQDLQGRNTAWKRGQMWNGQARPEDFGRTVRGGDDGSSFEISQKYADPGAGAYLRSQGWFSPGLTNLKSYGGFDPSSLYAPGATLESAPGAGRWGQGGVQAYRMDPKYQNEKAFNEAINPYFQRDSSWMHKNALGMLGERKFMSKNVDWIVPAALAVMGGAAVGGAMGMGPAAAGGGASGATGAAATGAATTGGAAGFGAAPLFGEAAVAGAPVVGAGGTLGTTALGSGALATEGLGAGSLWSGASGAMTAGAGAGTGLFANATNLDSLGTVANEGVTTPMADTVNDGWLYDQMGTGNASVDDIVAAEGGYSSLPSQGMEQAGMGLKMPSITDLAKFGYSIYNNQQQNDRAMQLYKQAQQGMQASDPFAPGRATALADYQKMMADPMSYMSSPLAQMQVDQMNRAQRAKQAQLGDTWSINPTTGAIQGSGTGAVDFATQMQQNLAKQYEAALKSRAEMAGMNLFPNAQMLQQMGSAAGMQNTAGNTGAGLFGYGVDLAKQTGVIDWAKGQLGGLFGA